MNKEKEIKVENEMVLTEDNGITYKILQEQESEETAALISDVFSRGEPMTKALEITPEEFQSLVDIYCQKATKEGFSIIAKDKEKVVGFVISEDFDSEQPEEIENIHTKVIPWMALIDAVEEEAKSNKKEGERRFHLFLGGTHKQYEGRHINTRMIEESLKLAKNKNFTSVMVEPTGFATQHLFRDKFGFEEIAFIEYITFQFEGKDVYKNIEGPDGLPLMEKKI